MVRSGISAAIRVLPPGGLATAEQEQKPGCRLIVTVCAGRGRVAGPAARWAEASGGGVPAAGGDRGEARRVLSAR
jgi:hypothetical protein